MRPNTLIALVLSMAILGIGCTTSTRINFDAPPGTVLFVDGEPHHLPGSISLSRPTEPGKSKRYPVSLATTLQQKELRASGYIDLFGYSESDLDKQTLSTCYLDDKHLSQINPNTTVVFRGETASRQHLYDLTLKKP